MKKILFVFMGVVIMNSCSQGATSSGSSSNKNEVKIHQKISEEEIVNYSLNFMGMVLTGGNIEEYFDSLTYKFESKPILDTLFNVANFGAVKNRSQLFEGKEGKVALGIEVGSSEDTKEKYLALYFSSMTEEYYPMQKLYTEIISKAKSAGMISYSAYYDSYYNAVDLDNWYVKISANEQSSTYKMISFSARYRSGRYEALNNFLRNSQNGSDEKYPVMVTYGKVISPDGYVNVRKGKGTNYEIIGTIRSEEEFQVKSIAKNWIRVKKGNLEGYVHRSGVSY